MSIYSDYTELLSNRVLPTRSSQALLRGIGSDEVEIAALLVVWQTGLYETPLALVRTWLTVFRDF